MWPLSRQTIGRTWLNGLRISRRSRTHILCGVQELTLWRNEYISHPMVEGIKIDAKVDRVKSELYWEINKIQSSLIHVKNTFSKYMNPSNTYKIISFKNSFLKCICHYLSQVIVSIDMPFIAMCQEFYKWKTKLINFSNNHDENSRQHVVSPSHLSSFSFSRIIFPPCSFKIKSSKGNFYYFELLG